MAEADPTPALTLPRLDEPGHDRRHDDLPPLAPAPPQASALPLHVALSGLAGLVATIVWAITGGGYYWPAWVWLGVGITVGDPRDHPLRPQRAGRPRATASRCT